MGSGVFENENANAWCDFLSLLKYRGIKVDKSHLKGFIEQCWYLSQSFSSAEIAAKTGSPNPTMVSAVTSILTSLGEDPLRKELVGTPGHFVKWLMNFQNTNMDMKSNGFG